MLDALGVLEDVDVGKYAKYPTNIRGLWDQR
jgi:hypothetical protein